jgi:ribosomal protein S18 acetylase RimI-like enzyme
VEADDAVLIREARREDLEFLKLMLYEAANRPGTDWPVFDVSMDEPRNRRFWLDWGREGDQGSIAQVSGTPVGAAWIRRFAGDDLSEVDDPAVPVLAIGVAAEHRGAGVGGLLMHALLGDARRAGVHEVALSTGLFNTAALRLYGRFGFEEVLRRGDGVRMHAILD